MKKLLSGWGQVPQLPPWRMGLAVAVAVVTDALQLGLGPLGWVGLDQGLEVAAMALTVRLLGFHWLLLPSFLLKMIPVADEVPTWTASVITVITLRRRVNGSRQNGNPSA